MNLTEIKDILERADRIGQPTDEPEGVRYIQISDTLTNEIINSLEDIISKSGLYGDK